MVCASCIFHTKCQLASNPHLVNLPIHTPYTESQPTMCLFPMGGMGMNIVISPNERVKMLADYLRVVIVAHFVSCILINMCRAFIVYIRMDACILHTETRSHVSLVVMFHQVCLLVACVLVFAGVSWVSYDTHGFRSVLSRLDGVVLLVPSAIG